MAVQAHGPSPDYSKMEEGRVVSPNKKQGSPALPKKNAGVVPPAFKVAQKANEVAKKLQPSDVCNFAYDGCQGAEDRDNLMNFTVFLLREEFMAQYRGDRASSIKGKIEHVFKLAGKKSQLTSALQATELLQSSLLAAGQTQHSFLATTMQRLCMCGNKVGDVHSLFGSVVSGNAAWERSVVIEYLKHPDNYPNHLNSAVAQSLIDLLSLLTLFILAIWPMSDTTHHFQICKPSNMNGYSSKYLKPPPGKEEKAEFADALFGIDLRWMDDSADAKDLIMDVANALSTTDDMTEMVSRFEQRTMGSFIEVLSEFSAILRSDIDEVTMLQQKLIALVQTLAIALVNFLLAHHAVRYMSNSSA